MNIIKLATSLLLSLLISVSVVACTKKNKDNNTQNAVSQKFSTTASEFTHDVEAKNWNEKGITVKYPMVVNSKDQNKADAINDLIMNDMSDYIDKIKSNIEDKSSVNIDAVYNLTTYSSSVLSIEYVGTYFAEKAAYPVNFYHTININLEDATRIQLSDLINITDSFVETFKNGIYAPYSSDLDLEASGVSIYDTLSEYTNSELIEMLKSRDAEYYMENQGIIVSAPVQHAIGDHMEVALNYEWIEECFNKEHIVWKNYLFISGEQGNVDKP